MLVRIADGHKIAFSHIELLFILHKPSFHLFLILAQGVAILAAPIGFPEGYSRVNLAIFTVLTPYIFISLFTLAFTVASILYSIRKWKVLFEPALTFLTIIVVTFAVSQLMMWLSLYVHMSLWERVLNILINFAVVELFVFIYAHFLQDYIAADMNRGSKIKGSVSTSTHITAGIDQPIAIDDILVIKAQAQYVEIQTATQSHVARVGFANIVLQMPPHTGIQIHRSTWVALKAIKSAHKTPDGIVISTQLDDNLKVARAREKDVREVLQDLEITY